jgi:hypothetical protein
MLVFVKFSKYFFGDFVFYQRVAGEKFAFSEIFESPNFRPRAKRTPACYESNNQLSMNSDLMKAYFPENLSSSARAFLEQGRLAIGRGPPESRFWSIVRTPLGHLRPRLLAQSLRSIRHVGLVVRASALAETFR